MSKRRVLIVDDEYSSRETLRRLVDWERLGFEPPVLAESGQRALELSSQKRFDLVLTDIEMPVMNGIELIRCIREQRSDQRIVVISCHEKFEYAKQAMRMGVADYLIKDLVTPNELAALACSFTAHSAEDEGTRPRREAGEMLRCAAKGEPAGEGALPCDTGAVFCVILDEYERLVLERGTGELRRLLENFEQNLDCAAYYDQGDGVIYVLCPLRGEINSMLYFLNAAITAANSIRSVAKKNSLRSASIGASDPVTERGRLPAACAQALEAAQMRIICGPDKTSIYNTIQLKKDVVDYQYTEYLLERVSDLGYNANAGCLRLVDKLYTVDLCNGLADVHYFRYINSRLWVICIHIAQNQGRDYGASLEMLGKDVDEVNRMESGVQMAQFFKSCLSSLCFADAPSPSGSIVDQALRLIEQEYTKDISLGSIAEQLHTNKSYLSRTFKEQTGENLMHYVVEKKITRAKYLLCNTHMKLYEVSEGLGFATPQYFSLVFKRYTGFPPNEYKRAMETPGIWMKYLMDQEQQK